VKQSADAYTKLTTNPAHLTCKNSWVPRPYFVPPKMTIRFVIKALPHKQVSQLADCYAREPLVHSFDLPIGISNAAYEIWKAC
jgi:hypothetical protein